MVWVEVYCNHNSRCRLYLIKCIVLLSEFTDGSVCVSFILQVAIRSSITLNKKLPLFTLFVVSSIYVLLQRLNLLSPNAIKVLKKIIIVIICHLFLFRN